MEPDALHLTRIVRQILRAATIVDSKTLRSLAGLLRPGFLTAEYLAGRRQPYLGPVKIYLVSAAIFFLTAPLAGFTLEALREREGLEWLDRLASQRLAARQLDPGHFAARFDLRFQTVYTALLAVSVAGGGALILPCSTVGSGARSACT